MKQLLKEMLEWNGFKTFKMINIGEIKVDKAGDYIIHLKPKHKEWKPINLHSVKLLPK